MHSTTLLVPLAFAMAACADPLPAPALPQGVSLAHQFQHAAAAHERRHTDDIPPAILCGAKYNDCGDGWCCSANQDCAGKIEGVPVCKDPTVTTGLLGGTAVAMPYDNLDEKLSSLSSVLETMTGGATDAAQSKQTGAAAATGLDGFGSTAALVVGLWGIAAMGGAGLFFL